MPMPRPSSLSWPAVIVCGAAVAYIAVVVTLASIGGPIPPAQINSIVAGAFAASAVIAVRPAASCRCSDDLAAMRRELRELRELVTPEEAAEGLAPEAIHAVRRISARLTHDGS